MTEHSQHINYGHLLQRMTINGVLDQCYVFEKEANQQGTFSTNAHFKGSTELSEKASQVSSDCLTFVSACNTELTRRFKTMSVTTFLAHLRDANVASTGSPNDKSLDFKRVQYSIYWEQHSCLRDGDNISSWERQVNENKFGNFFPNVDKLEHLQNFFREVVAFGAVDENAKYVRGFDRDKFTGYADTLAGIISSVKDRPLALAMGTHARLGEDCPARGLDDNMLRLIVDVASESGGAAEGGAAGGGAV